jgi:hypothetical protein
MSTYERSLKGKYLTLGNSYTWSTCGGAPGPLLEVLAVHDKVAECETAAPVPASEILVGELDALLMIVTVPVTLPVADGAKVTFNADANVSKI